MLTTVVANESFLDPVRAAEVWPETVATNEVFLEQLIRRKKLREYLENVITRLPQPDMSLEAALHHGYVSEEQVAEMYASLSILLESGRDYRRLVLYLPFEFLPNRRQHSSGKELRYASGRFRQAYMEAWKSLLSVHDVRANFVDGDVLEVERRTRDLPRVVKAAHLIPKLVERGLMEVKDVLALMEGSDDQILKNSIADTLPVLADLKLLDEEDIARMEQSGDRLLNSMARIIVSHITTTKRRVKTAPRTVTLSLVQEELRQEFFRADTQDYGDITEKRKAWLKQEKRQNAIDAVAEDIGTAIIEQRLTDETTASFLTRAANSASQHALIEGIRKALESIEKNNPGRALALYEHHKKTLRKLWENNDPGRRETLSKTFRRLRQLGVVAEKELAELGVVTPVLAGLFSENLKLIEEVCEIRKMATSIESNSELSRMIYPVVLVFGSRLNGYGEHDADIDLGVFVRSGTPFRNRTRLKKLLLAAFSHEKVRSDEVVEFWLEEKGGRLRVRNFAEPDVSLGKSYWTHVLFGAAWEGNESVMRELREKLLVPYLYDTGEVIEGRDARSLYLEEMEQATLQYRLMHKGYARFFPPYGGIHAPHADAIDGESMFWDSGYRQLATRLFASRVFLPIVPPHVRPETR